MDARVRSTLPGIAVLLCAQLLAFGDHTFNIVRQPASQVVIENCPVTFSVGVDRWGLSYQWLRDGEPIPGARNSAFTIPYARIADQGLYNVLVSNEHYSVLSSNAWLVISLDYIAPYPLEVVAGPNTNTLILGFQTACGSLNEGDSEDRWNYSLPGAEILSSELLATGRGVLLTTTPLTNGVTYQLRTSENIRDTFGNNSSPAELSFEAGGLPCPVHVDAIMSIQQPNDEFAGLGERPEFRVGVQGPFPTLTFQWETYDDPSGNWLSINGATQATLTLPPATTCAQSGAAYRCRLEFGECLLHTRTAMLTVYCDCSPPSVIGATPLAVSDGVIVEYNDLVIPHTATDIFNYSIQGLEVLSAEMQDLRRVLLRTSPQAPGQTYTIIINGVSDYSDPSCGANLIWPDSTISFRAPDRPRSGLYQIMGGFYSACCGFAGNDLGYDIPDDRQSFIRLDLDLQSDTVTMTFLAQDTATTFNELPCGAIRPIPFTFTNGQALSNRIEFRSELNPWESWTYTATYASDTLSVDGTVRTLPRCADAPYIFGHTNVFAILIPPAPRIESWERNGSELRFQFTGEPPYDYFVEYTDRLQPPNWLSLTNFRAKIQTIQAVVTDSTTKRPARFYRIRKEHCFCRTE